MSTLEFKKGQSVMLAKNNEFIEMKLIYKDSQFQIWGSDSILAINDIKKEYGKYTTDLEQVKNWTHEIVDSLSKDNFRKLYELIKSFINN